MEPEITHVKYEDSAMGKLQGSLASQHTEQMDELQKLRDDFDNYRAEQAAYQAAQEHRAKVAERKGFWLVIISNGIAAIIGGLIVYYWPSIVSFIVSFIVINRLSAKGTDGVMKRRCFRLKLIFGILSTGVFGTLHKPWR